MRDWTPAELKLATTMRHAGKSYADVSKALGGGKVWRGEKAVRHYLTAQGITKGARTRAARGIMWTEAQTDELIRLYLTGLHSHRKLATSLGKTHHSVSSKIRSLKDVGRLPEEAPRRMHGLHHDAHSAIIKMCRYITSDATIATNAGVKADVVTAVRAGLRNYENATGAAPRRGKHYLPPSTNEYEGGGDLTARKTDAEKGCNKLLAAMLRYYANRAKALSGQERMAA